MWDHTVLSRLTWTSVQKAEISPKCLVKECHQRWENSGMQYHSRRKMSGYTPRNQCFNSCHGKKAEAYHRALTGLRGIILGTWHQLPTLRGRLGGNLRPRLQLSLLTPIRFHQLLMIPSRCFWLWYVLVCPADTSLKMLKGGPLVGGDRSEGETSGREERGKWWRNGRAYAFTLYNFFFQSSNFTWVKSICIWLVAMLLMHVWLQSQGSRARVAKGQHLSRAWEQTSLSILSPTPHHDVDVNSM